jgi:DNA-directed RNA polymerase
VVDGISSERDLTAVAIDAAQRVEDQYKIESFRRQHPDLFTLTERRFQRLAVSDRQRRRAVMKLMANRADIRWKAWPKKVLVDFGHLLVEAVRDATGIVDIALEAENRRGRHRVKYTLKITEKMQSFLKWAADHLSMMKPRYQPTIVRPKRWTNPFNGGYWSGFLPLTLVKPYGEKAKRKHQLEELANTEMPDVYSALNAIQETPWKINKRVLEVLHSVIDRDLSIGGLPPMADDSLPLKPLDIAENEQALKEWKARAAQVYSNNKKQASKRAQVRLTVGIAEKFKDYAAIYFPHQLDFRGRAYAVPMFLNPQGPDYCKSLLTFAEGKPIVDGVAAGWLAIHGANLYGIDKVSFDTRISWVQEHEEAILGVASDPFAYETFWTSADKPWQFLAFCFEWAAFQAAGYGYVSSLPIALDGSCNGLQHYSAALRDEVGGKATNLMPAETPADIYSEVSKETVKTVEQDVVSGADPGSPEWFAAKWMEFGIDRKIAKRSVMTLPYGSTIYSCREFIEEAVRDKLAQGKPNVFRHVKRIEKADGGEEFIETDGVFDASLYLQGHIWRAIGRVVKAAVSAMAWLKACSKLASEEGLPVVWTVPDGFIVSQRYNEVKSRQVRTHLEGRVIYPRINEELDRLDKRRMAQGIAPNFVHSLDACAMRAYINLATDNGISAFGVVHDSFATVAADVDMMSVCIRESFAALYEQHDVLSEFRESIHQMLSEKRQKALPELPPKGDLDISQVRQSDFFFA